MDTSTHESVFEYLSFHHDLKRPYVSHDQVSCSKQSTIEESQVKELGIALSRIMHVQNVPLNVSSCDEPLGMEGKFCEEPLGKESQFCEESLGKEGQFSEEVKIDEPKFLNATTTQKVMNKCATFPTAKKKLPCPPEEERNDVPGIELHGDNNHMKIGNPVCSRSLSLPAPSNLVSAMKGGREKQGITPLNNLTVKWARDVYDPPTTSVSHSMKSQNQQQRSSSCSKSNKKKQQGKNKNNKGKSSRGTNGDKKQHRIKV